MTMRVLVTGSRDWKNIGIVRDTLQVTAQDGATLVHGGAKGLDTIAGQVAEQLGYVVEVHPADWSSGKRAGIERNAKMVALGADYCFAFPLPQSIGTWDCAKRAKAAGIPTFVYDPATYQWVQL